MYNWIDYKTKLAKQSLAYVARGKLKKPLSKAAPFTCLYFIMCYIYYESVSLKVQAYFQ